MRYLYVAAGVAALTITLFFFGFFYNDPLVSYDLAVVLLLTLVAACAAVFAVCREFFVGASKRKNVRFFVLTVFFAAGCIAWEIFLVIRLSSHPAAVTMPVISLVFTLLWLALFCIRFARQVMKNEPRYFEDEEP